MRIRLTAVFGLSLALLAAGLPIPARAQTAAPATMLGLPLGAMFEIIAVSGTTQPTVSWTMTHEDTFVDSRRANAYQTRLLQPGRYVLEGTLQDPLSGRQAARQFVITVRQEAAPPLPLVGATALIADTWPVRDAVGRIVSDEPVPVLKLTPNPDAPLPLQLDTDPTVDTDNDGNPANDQFARGTTFSADGSPLYLWFIDEAVERTVAVSGGDLEPQLLHVVSSVTAQAEDEQRAIAERENPAIIRTPLGRNTIGFGADLSEQDYGEEPLLLHWDFGDGKQSLLDRPVHRYAESGTYDIKLSVMNLTSGETAGEFVSLVTVETDAVPTEPGEPEPEPEPTPSQPVEGGGLLGTIVKVLIIAGLAVAAGFGVMFVLARILRKQGLQSAVATFEEKLQSKDQAKATVIDVPAPAMELSVSTPESAEAEEREPVSEPSPSVKEVVDTSDIPNAVVPAWLQESTAQPAVTSTPPDDSANSAAPLSEMATDDAYEETDDSEDGTGRIPPEQWAKLTPEERERERKRQKRRRYRQNKRQREQDDGTAAQSADSDVQFIVSADSLNTGDQPPAAAAPPQTEQNH